MHKIVSTLINRQDANLAQQWARDVLFQREDFPKESNAAILLVLAAHFCRAPAWQGMLLDEAWICNDFTLETLERYRDKVSGEPMRQLALFCQEQGFSSIKDLLIEEVPASFFGNGVHHYHWLDRQLGAQLKRDDVMDRLARHTMSSGDPEEVGAGLVWLGSQPGWETGDCLPISLEHHSKIAISVLEHHEQYPFQDGFLAAMINVHLDCFDESLHIGEIRRLEDMGIPRHFLFIDNRHKRIRLMDDLDI